MIQTKKQFIQEKYSNFIKVLVDKSTVSQEELENDPDIKEFKNMTEEDVLKFGITTLKPYKNNLDFPATRIWKRSKLTHWISHAK